MERFNLKIIKKRNLCQCKQCCNVFEYVDKAKALKRNIGNVTLDNDCCNKCNSTDITFINRSWRFDYSN